MTHLKTNGTILILALSIFLLGCSEQEIMDSYGVEIKQENEDVIKSEYFVSSCTFDDLKCGDFLVKPNSISLQIMNSQEYDLNVQNFSVSDCKKVISNPKIANYQIFQFLDCNNGGPNSTFDQDVILVMGDKKVTGHIRSLVWE